MTARWWREESFETGEVRSWRIGPLWLTVQRTAQEWKLAHRWTEWEDADPGWEIVSGGDFPEEGWDLTRFVFFATGSSLTLAPALADRPVVTSPRVPLFVLPGEKATLFVSTPLWLQVKGEGQVLLEVPVRRASDTWFGPSTREGELCYSTKTRAAVSVGNLDLLARRAVTPVQLMNRGLTPLRLERLKLPVPLLSLFGTDDGTLWTETVQMNREESSETATIDVRKGPPGTATGADLLAAPRQQVDENPVMQVFSTFGSLLRGMGDGNG